MQRLSITPSTSRRGLTHTDALSIAQEKALILVPLFPSFLSILGSVMLMTLVRRSKSKGSLQRLLLCLASSDIIFSIAFVLQSFMEPREPEHQLWAVGNNATCTLAGFLIQFTTATIWYCIMMSFYFLLTIRFGIKPHILERRIEPWMHLLALGYPLATATAGAFLGYYGNEGLGRGCWLKQECSGDDTTTDGNDGSSCAPPYVDVFFGGLPLVFLYSSLVLNNIAILCYVHRVLKQSSHRAAFSSADEARHQRTRAVATQATFYVVAALLVYVWPMLIRVKSSRRADIQSVYPYLILNQIFFPCLGFFNLLVYLRPRYLQMRKAYPLESRVWALRQALAGETSTLNNISQGQRRSRRLPTIQNNSSCVIFPAEPERLELTIAYQTQPEFFSPEPEEAVAPR